MAPSIFDVRLTSYAYVCVEVEIIYCLEVKPKEMDAQSDAAEIIKNDRFSPIYKTENFEFQDSCLKLSKHDITIKESITFVVK